MYQKMILEDESFVRTELQKFTQYYNLKHTIRWARDRQGDVTESVAEHVFGMHVLANYFLPLEDPTNELDHELVYHYITWHDMAEALVSDMTTKDKTTEHEAAEKRAEAQLVEEAPMHLKSILAGIYKNYDARATKEAAIVKALDKIEPLFHLYFLKTSGVHVPDHYAMQWTGDEYRAHRVPYLEQFPIIKKFDDVLYVETLEYYPNK